MQVFGDRIGCLEYEAVDISESMHQMGERMLHAAYVDRVVYHKLSHFEELNDDDWNALSSVPTVIFFKLMEFARNRQSYFDISPSDYVSGNFVVGEAGALDSVGSVSSLDSLGSCDGQRNAVFPVGELSSDETFDRTFRTVVEEPVKGDAMTRWPQYVLGNEFATNQALIDYGRSHFVQSKIIQTDLKDTSGRNRMRTFTPADQVLVYCHNMMPAHYACAMLMYGWVREWV